MSTPIAAAQTRRQPPAIMRPGIALMRRISMKTKLLGIASLLLVPLVAAMLMLTQHLRNDINVAEAELEGVSAVEALTDVALHIQTHRGP